MQGSNAQVRSDVERVYRDVGDRLWWAVLAFAGDPDVASDAVAEAFAQALRRGEAVRSVEAWVWTAAFRIAAGELQGRRRFTDRVPESAYEPFDVPDRLFEILPSLPARQRAAVILHYYVDKPVTEIAEILGCSATTVSVHLHRGRNRLRELLEVEDA